MQVLIVGGTAIPDKGPQVPFAEMFNPADPAAGTILVNMPEYYKSGAGANW